VRPQVGHLRGEGKLASWAFLLHFRRARLAASEYLEDFIFPGEGLFEGEETADEEGGEQPVAELLEVVGGADGYAGAEEHDYLSQPSGCKPLNESKSVF
jgi:hypothetical protein